jgi:methyl-accepting chemotaxis protein
MKNLKIAQKLIFSFLVISLITAIIGAAGIYSMLQMSASSTKLYEKQTVPLPVISDIILNMDRLRGQARDYIIYANNKEQLNAIEEKTKQYESEYEQEIKQYAPTISTAATQTLFDETKKIYTEQFIPAFEDLIKTAESGDNASATKKLDAFKTINQKIIDNYTQCMQNRVNNAKINNDSNNQLADTMTIILIIIVILGIAVSVCWGIWIARALSKPINQMSKAAEELAEGKLDVDITYVSKDEIGSLANSLKSATATLKLYIRDISTNLDLMAQGDMSAEITQEYIGDFIPIKQALLQISSSLNHTLSLINSSSDQVNSGAGQVSDGAQELAQGATEQASSVEELAASSSEVSEKVRQNAENVRLVSGYVKETTEKVEQGTSQMKQMLSSMQEINASSNEIGKIIKVIDDIAFQTNILALNAAVEAARAGSAGKGFAVVADEVRNLASKSANAAKQTTALIESSIQSVKGGSKIADFTANDLNEIAAKVKLVGETIQKIDRASSDQAIAIQQITQGVEQVSSVVQTNSATAEESAAASEELSAQADMLSKLIAKFKLKANSAQINQHNFSKSDIAKKSVIVSNQSPEDTDDQKY